MSDIAKRGLTSQKAERPSVLLKVVHIYIYIRSLFDFPLTYQLTIYRYTIIMDFLTRFKQPKTKSQGELL